MEVWLEKLVSGMPDELAVLILSMIPVSELRLSIPLALTKFDMQPLEALIIAIIGNLIPVPFIILFIRRILNWMKKIKYFKKIADYLESKGIRNAQKASKSKILGIILFVAIPLPGTGAWTGALIASFLDMRLKKAIPAITLGLIIAGIIVTLVSTGIIHIFS